VVDHGPLAAAEEHFLRPVAGQDHFQRLVVVDPDHSAVAAAQVAADVPAEDKPINFLVLQVI
jgi:hypothetical protein